MKILVRLMVRDRAGQVSAAMVRYAESPEAIGRLSSECLFYLPATDAPCWLETERVEVW